jgi:hypothetical protein
VLKYAPPNKVETKHDLTAFVDEFLAKKVKPLVKSQQDPVSPNPKLVKALNTDSFNVMLASDVPNVLVYFDGPGCFSCVEAWPVFEQTTRVL